MLLVRHSLHNCLRSLKYKIEIQKFTVNKTASSEALQAASVIPRQGNQHDISMFPYRKSLHTMFHTMFHTQRKHIRTQPPIYCSIAPKHTVTLM